MSEVKTSQAEDARRLAQHFADLANSRKVISKDGTPIPTVTVAGDFMAEHFIEQATEQVTGQPAKPVTSPKAPKAK